MLLLLVHDTTRLGSKMAYPAILIFCVPQEMLVCFLPLALLARQLAFYGSCGSYVYGLLLCSSDADMISCLHNCPCTTVAALWQWLIALKPVFAPIAHQAMSA